MPTPHNAAKAEEARRLRSFVDERGKRLTIREIAQRIGMSYGFCSEACAPAKMGRTSGATYHAADVPARLPDPAPEAGGPTLPEPVTLCQYDYVRVSGPSVWGIISDVHIPYHDKTTLEKWVAECKRMNAAGILLNGDILDCYQVSEHLRDPSAPRVKEEIEKGRQFLSWLRGQFPAARIIYKAGNHDERLKNYLMRRAPEIFDLEDVRLVNLLRTSELGIEWVEDKRVIMLGKLPVIHGHEYAGGGGVMPARWFYLRTGGSVLGGHFHQPSFYPFRTITDQDVGCWSMGCACWLAPAFRPLNQWAHGWAMVEIHADNGYSVHNRRLLGNQRVA